MLKRRNEGSITVEATLSLFSFLAIILVMTLIINVVSLYGKIQFAISQTAKEISSYSYLYVCSGLHQLEKDILDDSRYAAKDIEEIMISVLEVCDGIKEVKNNTGELNAEATISEIKQVINEATLVSENFSRLAKEPEKLLVSLLYLGYMETYQNIKTQVLGGIINALLPKYLANSKDSADNYLKQFYVRGGMSGLDFSDSSFLNDGKTIEIIVNYKVSHTLPLFNLIEHNISQRVSVDAWLNGDKDYKDEKTSVWHDSNYFIRGKKIISMESLKYQYSIIDVPGLHSLNRTEDYLEVIRIFSYDTTKKTNDIEQFKKIIKKHFSALDNKVSLTQHVQVEDNSNGQRHQITLQPGKHLRKKLLVIVPEDADESELQEMEYESQIITSGGLYRVEIRRGYGNAHIK